MLGVSVILAVRNERRTIADALESLLRQDRRNFDELEILVVDGDSTDGSAEIAQEFERRFPNVRVVRNERKITPVAFNLGLKAASFDYVCIFGSHAKYADDYIAVCVEEMARTDAVGVSGRVVIERNNSSIGASVVYWLLTHPFGSSSGSFRNQHEGFVDTIAYPLFKKKELLALGGYNTALTRNQDNDMNARLREAGQKLYCTWRTKSIYSPRGSIGEILRYAFRNGLWNGRTWHVRPASMSLRHFVPFFFVATMLIGFIAIATLTGNAVLATSWVIGVALIHIIAGMCVSLRIMSREHSMTALLMPAFFFAFHFLYGIGTVVGLLNFQTNATMK